MVLTCHRQRRHQLGYDANGNLHTSGNVLYCYDSDNRLTGVGSGANCTRTASLSYDPAGQLASIAAGATQSDFAYDGLNMIAEYAHDRHSGTDSLTADYVFGPAVDEPIVQYDSAGNRTWLTSTSAARSLPRPTRRGR